MKFLIVFGLILCVEFSQQIPVNKIHRKLLPLPTVGQKDNKIFETFLSIKRVIKDDAIDNENGYLKVSPRRRISRIGKLPPYKNLEIRSIKNDEKEIDESFVLNDKELVDLIVDEASADLTGLKTADHDLDNAQQRQKRGWFKKIWRSVEKRFKEILPVAVVAAIG